MKDTAFKEAIKKTTAVFLIITFAFSFFSCKAETESSIESSNEADSEEAISSSLDSDEAEEKYDLVVYGDTAAAVVAAVSASRQNIKVALVAPNVQLGGMLSGGLCQTDLGDSSVIGGMALEFFERNAEKKGTSSKVDWYFEPHVAEEIFADMLEETKTNRYSVEVFLGERLSENNGVIKSGATITEILCESGKIFKAKQFIDASYEGDLMAQAGVSYTFGREGREVYGESLAGVVSPSTEGANNHNFNFKISAYDEEGNLKYKEVSTAPLAETGSGDKKIQAYNFRVVLTNNKDNQLPFPKPEEYDRTRYALLADYIKAWVNHNGKAPTAYDLFGFHHVLNNDKDKWDFNNKGAFSSDYIGGSYGYPDSTYAEREQIWQEHYNYVAGLFYFLANDPDVPASTRKDVSSYGLPKDEYTKTGNFTFQLYIREGRRMLGEYVMTQKDIEKNGGASLLKDDTIGMGSYNSDSHHVQRYITKDGYIRNEGNMEVRVDPYEIPYRVLLPKKEEADNLLVTCTVSASHVAYSTIRMEPQYMIMGEAAGVAVSLAVNDETKVHSIDVSKLQSILKKGGTVLSKHEKSKTHIDIYENNVLFFDSFVDSFDDRWQTATGTNSTVLSKKQTLTEKESFIKLYKKNLPAHAYFVPKVFVAPDGDFTFTARVKIEPYNQRCEFAIRSKNYLVKLIIVSDGKTVTLQDKYEDTDKKYIINSGVWHEYKIVADADDSYSYDLYVDGVLAWENAVYTSGFGNDILKIGGDKKAEVGEKISVMTLCLDYVKIERGEEKENLRVIGSNFKDAHGNKINNITEENEVNCDVYLQNNTGASQKVKIVAELYHGDVLQQNSTVSKSITAEHGIISNSCINVKVAKDKKDQSVRIKVLYGENFDKVLTDNIILES